MEVYDALNLLRRHCENQPKCHKCILHMQNVATRLQGGN